MGEKARERFQIAMDGIEMTVERKLEMASRVTETASKVGGITS